MIVDDISIGSFLLLRIQPITAHIAQLAMTSQVLPQRAACALHLVYAIACGTKFLLNSEEYIDTLSSIFVRSECDVSGTGDVLHQI